MKILIKLLIFGIVIVIVYYLMLEYHLLEIIIDTISNVFKFSIRYVYDMIGNLI